MAILLENITLPRATGFPAATLSPIVGSLSVSPISNRREVIKLPESRGLKISSRRGSVSYNSKLVRRSARIVAEAQDTAVVGSILTADFNFTYICVFNDFFFYLLTS